MKVVIVHPVQYTQTQKGFPQLQLWNVLNGHFILLTLFSCSVKITYPLMCCPTEEAAGVVKYTICILWIVSFLSHCNFNPVYPSSLFLLFSVCLYANFNFPLMLSL